MRATSYLGGGKFVRTSPFWSNLFSVTLPRCTNKQRPAILQKTPSLRCIPPTLMNAPPVRSFEACSSLWSTHAPCRRRAQPKTPTPLLRTPPPRLIRPPPPPSPPSPWPPRQNRPRSSPASASGSASSSGCASKEPSGQPTPMPLRRRRIKAGLEAVLAAARPIGGPFGDRSELPCGRRA